MESSTVFQRAVAAGSVAATRAAIIDFFAAHIHVVRVRVTIGQRLLIDEGGPFVLAPVHGTLRSGGRVVGHFEMAIQDDAGYLKLAHLFTGARSPDAHRLASGDGHALSRPGYGPRSGRSRLPRAYLPGLLVHRRSVPRRPPAHLAAAAP